MKKNRSAATQYLIEFAAPLDQIRERLAQFEWDYDGTTVVLSREHIIDVLRRYVRGEISAHALEDWANLIEGREDISLADNDRVWIEHAIYELANPVLTRALDNERAIELIDS